MWKTVVILNKTGIINLNEGKLLAEDILTNMNHRRYSTNKNINSKVNVSEDRIKKILSIEPPYNLKSGETHFVLSQKYIWNQLKIRKLNNEKLEYQVHSISGYLLHKFDKPSICQKELNISEATFYLLLRSKRPYKNRFILTSIIIKK